MSHSTNNKHKEELSERSYIAAAHRDDRSEESRLESLEKAKEIHLARTGSELHEDLEKKENPVAQPGLAETEEGRKERAFIAAAHREGRDEEGKQESLEKASALHEERTGEPLAEAEELQEEESAKEHKKKDHKKSSKESKHKKSPKKAAKEHKKKKDEAKEEEHLERQERSLIGAAHRKGRDQDAKQESLAKASKIHEERTGEPLPEAVEKGAVEETPHKRHHKGDKEEKSKHQKTDDKSDSANKDVEQPGLAGSADGRHERAFIAAAHRDGRSEEGKLESLQKASELHEKRTGEPLPEAVEKGVVDDDNGAEVHHKRHHEEDKEESPKRQKTEDKSEASKAEQPGLAGTAEGRQERAFIAAAHRDGRSEEGQLDSLQKASDLHEKRTGEPLPEALERGVAAQ